MAQRGGAGRGQGRKPLADKKTQRYTLLLRSETWNAVEVLARIEGSTVNQVCEKAIIEYLERSNHN